MKIKTRCRRPCQAAGTSAIHRSLLISAAMLCVCLALVQNADALGVQLQGGFGDDSGLSEFGFSYERADLNIFFHDGELFDLFIGGERASSKHRPDAHAIIVSSYAYNAAVLGMRVKLVERGSVSSYLMLGVLGGKVRYSAYANDSYVIIAQSRDDASFARGRAGLGVNIEIKKVAIAMEVNCSGGVPAAHATVTDPSGPVGNRSDRAMFEGSPIVNIAVGVQYSFF